jgi:hypothetical protein
MNRQKIEVALSQLNRLYPFNDICVINKRIIEALDEPEPAPTPTPFDFERAKAGHPVLYHNQEPTTVKEWIHQHGDLVWVIDGNYSARLIDTKDYAMAPKKLPPPLENNMPIGSDGKVDYVNGKRYRCLITPMEEIK